MKMDAKASRVCVLTNDVSLVRFPPRTMRQTDRRSRHLTSHVNRYTHHLFLGQLLSLAMARPHEVSDVCSCLLRTYCGSAVGASEKKNYYPNS